MCLKSYSRTTAEHSLHEHFQLTDCNAVCSTTFTVQQKDNLFEHLYLYGSKAVLEHSQGNSRAQLETLTPGTVRHSKDAVYLNVYSCTTHYEHLQLSDSGTISLNASICKTGKAQSV